MSTLTFTVRRHDPELIGPATPTPRETKLLSDIDDQGMRMHMPHGFFYHGGHRGGDDPAAVISRALSEALVPYYPLAGRLREVAGRKLVVDCTGEGVLFVEADADVRLAELEEETGGVREPLPCMDQLLFDVEGSNGFLNCPLILIQVPRIKLMYLPYICSVRIYDCTYEYICLYMESTVMCANIYNYCIITAR